MLRRVVGSSRVLLWCCGSRSLFVFLAHFVDLNVPSRIGSKIRVLLTPAAVPGWSGLRPSRGMLRPVTFGSIESMVVQLCVRRHSAVRNRIRQQSEGCNPG